MTPATRVALPSRTASALWRTQASAAGSASGYKHQAAFHTYSSTWMKSQMMETSTPRVFASARMRSIWWLAPPTSATQARVWFGSRRSASSKMACTTLAASSTTLAVSHLLLAVGPAVTSARLAPQSGMKDVGRDAHDGCRVVDGAQFGHAFAVALLALGQPGRQLGGGLRGGPGGGRTQRLGAHHDALAVCREGQHVARIGGRRQLAGGVEIVEVDRGAGRQFRHLTLTEPIPRWRARRLPPPCRRSRGRPRPRPAGAARGNVSPPAGVSEARTTA